MNASVQSLVHVRYVPPLTCNDAPLSEPTSHRTGRPADPLADDVLTGYGDGDALAHQAADVRRCGHNNTGRVSSHG